MYKNFHQITPRCQHKASNGIVPMLPFSYIIKFAPTTRYSVMGSPKCKKMKPMVCRRLREDNVSCPIEII
jgi:hypothetical protein